MGVAAELGLHSDYQIEQLLSLNVLCDRLSANRSRNHSFYVRNVDSIPRDFVPIDIDQEAGLSKFAHHGDFSEAGHLSQRILDLDRLVLKNVEILTIDLDCQRTLEAGERLVHS